MNSTLKEKKEEIEKLEDTLHKRCKEYYKLKMRELVNTADKFEKGRGIFYYDILDELDTVKIINIQDIAGHHIGESKVIIFTFSRGSIFDCDYLYNSFEMHKETLADCYTQGDFSPEKYLTADEFLEFKTKAELDVVTNNNSAITYLKEINKKRI